MYMENIPGRPPKKLTAVGASGKTGAVEMGDLLFTVQSWIFDHEHNVTIFKLLNREIRKLTSPFLFHFLAVKKCICSNPALKGVDILISCLARDGYSPLFNLEGFPEVVPSVDRLGVSQLRECIPSRGTTMKVWEWGSCEKMQGRWTWWRSARRDGIGHLGLPKHPRNLNPWTLSQTQWEAAEKISGW